MADALDRDAALGAPAPGEAARQDAALTALRLADFDWTRSLRSVWHDASDHVPAINGGIRQLLVDEFTARTGRNAQSNPLGRVILGPPGAGKTHLLGSLRAEIWRRGGWFVLLDLLVVRNFWETAALGFLDALEQPMPGGLTQAQKLLADVEAASAMPAEFIARLRGPHRELCLLGAKGVLAGLRMLDITGARRHADVALAFALLNGGDPELRDLARAWLLGAELAEDDRAALGVAAATPSPRATIEGLSWLMSLGGPTLIAVDQLDAIVQVAHAEAAMPAGGDKSGEDPVQARAQAVIDGLAGGLMALRDVTRRSMTLLSTLTVTWEALAGRALGSFRDRFHDPLVLRPLATAESARALVAARMAPACAEAGVTPPYPTWPFRPECFAAVTEYSPRRLLRACEAHRAACLARGAVAELIDLAPAPGAAPPIASPLIALPPPAPASAGTDFDALYERHRREAAVATVLDPASDGVAAAGLLIAALRALARQNEPDILALETEVQGVVARLRLMGATEREVSFSVLPHKAAAAVQAGLKSAMTASGIDPKLPSRQLVVLRRTAWPSGIRTHAAVSRFNERGGKVLAPDETDLRRFAALKLLLDSAAPGLDAWLQARRPLAESDFCRALGLVRAPAIAASPAAPAPAIAALRTSTGQKIAPPNATGFLPIGVRASDQKPVLLPLALLPRHVAVIAGAGSGKTVLLRRIVEEAALAGIPSIVLDSNNDLVRLADEWPAPSPLSPDDAARAGLLGRVADVVVWTPGRSRGNPLSLPPLPEFAAVADDADEREACVGVAAATLEPLIGVGGAAGILRAGVLRDTLRHFALAGGGRLDDLIALLRDLPPGSMPIGRAAKIAAEIADALLAARSRNPLFDAAGTPLDAAMLLAGRDGRARISVINLAGLPDDAARQDFVGRLLMALFSHVRRHPASGATAVSGLLVMDEAQNFAPSGQGAASKAATVALARQARKYGLGMLFATQAPRAVDSNIIGNCTTQLYGRANAPAAIETLRELMAARGGAADDLGRLERGTFYLTTEGIGRPQKIMTPLCLTHHPANPPSEEEVLARGAAFRAG